MEESEVCPGCGQPLSECADPRNEFAYRADVWKCHACTAKDAEDKKYTDAEGTYYLTVRKR